MRSQLRMWFFAALVAAGASGVHGASAHADVGFYSNGASALSPRSGRGRYAGPPGPRTVYRLPAQGPGAVVGYWYYSPQPVYQLPAQGPGAVSGYWYYYPQPIYQPPVPRPEAVAGYWYYYPVRR